MYKKIYKSFVLILLFFLLPLASFPTTTSCTSVAPSEKNIDHELLLAVKESMAVLEIIESFSSTEAEKLQLQCSGCKKQKLACSGLVGHFAAARNRAKIDELKKLLDSKEVLAITAFMEQNANESKVFCPECESFKGWEKLS